MGGLTQHAWERRNESVPDRRANSTVGDASARMGQLTIAMVGEYRSAVLAVVSLRLCRVFATSASLIYPDALAVTLAVSQLVGPAPVTISPCVCLAAVLATGLMPSLACLAPMKFTQWLRLPAFRTCLIIHSSTPNTARDGRRSYCERSLVRSETIRRAVRHGS